MLYKMLSLQRFQSSSFKLNELCIFFCVKESEIQLGPRDRGDDSWIVFLGLHSDSDTRRIYLLKTGCQQVTASDIWKKIYDRHLYEEIDV